MRRSTHVSRFRAAGAALAVLLGLALPAAAPAAEVSVPATTSVGVGADGTVAVSIDTAAGVEAGDFRFTFPTPGVVQFNGDAVPGELINGCTPVSNVVDGTAQIGFACTGPLSASNDHVLFSLPVHGVAPGSTTMLISRCDLNETSIGCTPIPGMVNVPSPTSTPTNTASATPSQTSTRTPTRTVPPSLTRTPTRTGTSTRTPVVVVPPVLDPIASAITVGAAHTLSGSGFTAGSVVKIFISAGGGAIDGGAYAPSARTATSITWQVPSSLPLGSGFATLLVINTDQNYVQSNSQSQLLYGAASANIPTIRSINGVDLHALDPSVPLAYVETVVSPGSPVTITGTGFNSPLVNIFTATGNIGPRAPQPGSTSTFMQIVIPSTAPTGPGSFQVVNNPYTGNVLSNAVSVPIGALLTITSISQSGNTVTVNGTGFSTVSVINLFNAQGGGAVNLGGLGASGPNVPLNIVSPTQFTFTVPAGAVSGPSYIQVLNPPFIAYSSSGSDPDGAFNLVVP